MDWPLGHCGDNDEERFLSVFKPRIWRTAQPVKLGASKEGTALVSNKDGQFVVPAVLPSQKCSHRVRTAFTEGWWSLLNQEQYSWVRSKLTPAFSRPELREQDRSHKQQLVYTGKSNLYLVTWFFPVPLWTKHSTSEQPDLSKCLYTLEVPKLTGCSRASPQQLKPLDASSAPCWPLLKVVSMWQWPERSMPSSPLWLWLSDWHLLVQLLFFLNYLSLTVQLRHSTCFLTLHRPRLWNKANSSVQEPKLPSGLSSLP